MKHTGHLEISAMNYEQFVQLEEVTGNLTIRIEHGTQRQVDPIVGRLSVLARVGGNLELSSKVELPRLVSVTGDLSLYDVEEPTMLRYEGDEGENPKAGEQYLLSALSSVNGNLKIFADVKMPALTLVGGYLHIDRRKKIRASFAKESGAKAILPSLASITGSLTIVDQAEVHAPVLTVVGSDVHLTTDACLPALDRVGGDLAIRYKARVQVPVLTNVTGNVQINGNAALPMLTTVKGNFRTQGNDAELPSLMSVGGNIKIDYRASLPLLANVGGNISVSYPVEMPALERVGGYLNVGKSATLSVPMLTCAAGSPYPFERSKRHMGHLEIDAVNSEKFGSLTEVIGDLVISTAIELPLLVRVSGNLTILQDVRMPVLRSIGGNLTIQQDSRVDLPELLSVGSDCVLVWNKSWSAFNDIIPCLPKLVIVGGRLDMVIGCELPALSEVGGDLNIHSGELPMLRSVGGMLEIRGDARLSMLTSVGDDLHIHSNVELPRLIRVVGGVYISGRVKLPILMSVGDSLHVSASSWLPMLREVGKDMKISSHVQLPLLTRVGGCLMMNHDVELPVLAEVGGALRLEVGNTGKLPLLAFVGGGVMIMSDIELPMLTVLYGEVFVMRTATLRIPRLKVGSEDTK
ncbi:hypothetical protein [Janthinobacterium sp. NKUCC06_STL]|uniref:hypothetical protein n=1 Tax=Janthinobacterium sp. NKUCC06_STL TaxID=2842127 RepID=UPI001C5BC7B0|nr:hypothetical protein [Janthinobacterium sp. NKUCC06_STL]MBW3512163.1 hypothetical protein [Janthinobacterium sp. NKUCC06_STL]